MGYCLEFFFFLIHDLNLPPDRHTIKLLLINLLIHQHLLRLHLLSTALRGMVHYLQWNPSAHADLNIKILQCRHFKDLSFLLHLQEVLCRLQTSDLVSDLVHVEGKVSADVDHHSLEAGVFLAGEDFYSCGVLGLCIVLDPVVALAVEELALLSWNQGILTMEKYIILSLIVPSAKVHLAVLLFSLGINESLECLKTFFWLYRVTYGCDFEDLVFVELWLVVNGTLEDLQEKSFWVCI